MASVAPPTATSFEQRLTSAAMPPPGPDFFHARRSLWWEPGPNPPHPAEPTVARRRLEHVLAQEGAHEDDHVWKTGVEKVWRGLTSGALLKNRLPLHLVIKILMAGWIRDGTWPRGGVAPDPDDELEEVPPDMWYASPPVLSNATTNIMSRVPSPWSPEEMDMPEGFRQWRGRSRIPARDRDAGC